MRFGILGDAKIAREKLRPAILSAGHHITAIGRRDVKGNARGAVDPIWGDVAIKSYDELLADPEIDAVYIPLPNHLHVTFAIKALEAGKPVICEKPVALSLEELERLRVVAERSGVYLYDGYMVRFHPQWQWLKEIDVGERQQLIAHFSYPPQPQGNIRNIAAWGGGPIWDIGCYCLLSGLMLFDGVPELQYVIKTPEEALDVEKSAAAIISFGAAGSKSQILNLSCSSGMGLSQSVHLIGSKGWARLDVPFNPPMQTKGRYALAEDGIDTLLGLGKEVVFAPCDQYQVMVEDFAMAISEGRKTDLTQSYHLTKILAEMAAS